MKKSMKKGLLIAAACLALGVSATAVARESSNRANAEQAIETVVDAAVIRFQKKNGLKADGVVGKSTYKALGMTSSYEALNGAQSSGSAGSYNSSDVYLLAKTIYAEGRGEPYVGQVAIGAVVLNRVRNNAFPNTISGVVYQKHAFTAVSDGQINLTPNETAMKAARDAINGWDPTGGALYYYNPAVATSQWIFSRPTITVIGKHVFAM